MAQKLEEAEVQNLQDTLGSHKVNLIHRDGDSEGVWATYLTPEDKAIYKASSGTYKAVLLNDPLGWQGRQWGDVIVATTRGSARPIARWQDNPIPPVASPTP